MTRDQRVVVARGVTTVDDKVLLCSAGDDLIDGEFLVYLDNM